MSESANNYLHTCDDGITRCWWGKGDGDYQSYHDREWGHPSANDFQLFEKICLEGFQSGLSWLTILRKRENFRSAFANFDFAKVALFDEDKVALLLQDAGIVRHRGKIEATINNAQRALQLVDEFGSLAAYIWQWEPQTREAHIGKGEYHHPIPSITQTSQQLSKDLKKRGWKFFGPTTAYAFMQAMGLVNDHMPGCASHELVKAKRQAFTPPTRHNN
ncbi:3-methyladenine DNA glycosylase [Gammaproteobacteria bacterium 54_18_T64]|nr:3-methyladenine DNA glycosylase [Gammaproteobacteria bacterium 54_18_T64]